MKNVIVFDDDVFDLFKRPEIKVEEPRVSPGGFLISPTFSFGFNVIDGRRKVYLVLK